MIWQILYWKVRTTLAIFPYSISNPLHQFVLVDRRQKIESGERTTSFSFLLNDKRGAIGRSLSSVPQQYRESAFMFGQLGKHYLFISSNLKGLHV